MNYHQILQAELDRRPALRALPLVGLSAHQLLAIARRDLPVFNITTCRRQEAPGQVCTSEEGK